MRHNGEVGRGVFLCAGLVNTVPSARVDPGPAVGHPLSGARRKRPSTVACRCTRPSRGAAMNRVCRRFLLNVSAWVWIVTLVALVAVLAVDLLIVGRRPHEPSMREAGSWVGFYVAFALLFGVGVWLTSGGTYAAEFY